MTTSETGNPEIDNKTNLPDEPDRRQFIEKATCVVAGAGIVAATWPFISSMNPASNVLSKSTVEVDISKIQSGETKTVEWQSKPVFIYHRPQTQISAMQNSKGSDIDPQADEERVQNPEWLVVIGLCTHLGCVPTKKSEGWFCPCHGSRYDNSGRVLRGPAPKNLYLLPYQFVSAEKLLLGKA
ncbi:Ubiquinol-cytochrome C reductase iron-sulfur subunit [hydrothermal vent metagenome]|uniref:Ubiquinol-cytochrome c reductase iron-sulfur subunit n=1 Tax=hydrothermal vent metagenome TaxID=652676 RepID=A0A3B0ZF93_9ZZZZ